MDNAERHAMDSALAAAATALAEKSTNENVAANARQLAEAAAALAHAAKGTVPVTRTRE